MAQSILDPARSDARSATIRNAACDPTTHRLTGIITTLLCDSHGSSLPDWNYRTWCRALAYPDAHERATPTTKKLGRRRDEALSRPPVRRLVEWAGSRRRANPAAGAAAALTMLRLAEVRSGGGPVDVPELTHLVALRVDSAEPIRSSSSGRRVRVRLLADLDELPVVEQDHACTENPHLSAAVRELLRLAGADSDSPFVNDAEAAVVQAGDWWTRHATPLPASIKGPRLPGVLPMRQLWTPDRLQAYLSHPALFGLVAGPPARRGRSCQVVWRQGLTFWVAVRLSQMGVKRQPPVETIRWWRSQLSALGCGLAPARPRRHDQRGTVPRESNPTIEVTSVVLT
jgi:hypothetical protein